MTLFEDEAPRGPRADADWELLRRHRTPQSGPPQDEVGVLALSSFLLARTGEVAVAVRGITAYSDGLHLQVCALFADEQKAGDLQFSLEDYSRSPGRFRLGVQFSDGRRATTGQKDAPDVEPVGDLPPTLLLLTSETTGLRWDGSYWLWPLPPLGPLVIGCRWPDMGVAETLVRVDPAPLLEAAATSRPVWET